MIIQLPMLYSRRSDGKTQTVLIEVENNKYRTTSGIMFGKVVISEWSVCKGKNTGRANATTDDEQALFEAKAKWQKKKNEKYSESIEAMDAERVYSPMLAKVYEDYEKELFNTDGSAKVMLFTQPKFDGLRTIATKDGLFSRNGKPYVAVPHIIEALAPIFAQYPDAVLDGEMYAHHLKDDFNKICSCVKRTKPNESDFKTSQQIQYHIYDLASSDKDFLSRQQELSVMLRVGHSESNTAKYILQSVPTFVIEKKSDVVSYYEKFIEDGYEGSMIRTNGKYENKRSKTLLKYKSFQDAEFTILDITEGIGNRAGLCGYMSFEKDREPFKSNVKGDREFLKELLDNKANYIGKTATIKYFNLTPAPRCVPRFPVVVKVAREDVE